MSETIKIMNELNLEIGSPILIAILGKVNSGKNQIQYKFITDYTRKNLPVLVVNTEINNETSIRFIKRKLDVYGVENKKNIFLISGEKEKITTSKILNCVKKHNFKSIFIESIDFIEGNLGFYDNKKILLLEKNNNEIKVYKSSIFNRIDNIRKTIDDLRHISLLTKTHIYVSQSIYSRQIKEDNDNILLHPSQNSLIMSSDVVLLTNMNFQQEEQEERTINVKIVKNRFGLDGRINENFKI